MDPRDLLERIEKYLQANSLTETAFGVKALGDPNLIRDLRDGREPRRKTISRIIEFMDSMEQAA